MNGNETSSAIEDYLKTIYVISERSGKPASTSAIAERIKVAPASVSAMVKRLEELGYATREPYKGVALSSDGRMIALEVLRHHRLLELFLAETFDMPWDQVHDEAEVLEHVISEELEELIAAKLGHPRFDPHGDPIPTRNGEVAGGKTTALSDLEPGQGGVFVRVSDSEPEMLRFLTENGIARGQTFEVVEKQPFDGPLFVTFGDDREKKVIGRRLAAAMRVTDGSSELAA